jgi:Flp pilus assembly protein TadG
MMRQHPLRQPGSRRTGKVLVMFVLLMSVLLGMVGLTVDGGLMLVVYRQTQNAADAAALAAAVDILNGASADSARATGQTYVQTDNNMPGATVTINIPPASGPHSGSSQYAEAIVSYPFQTSFIQVLGVNASQTVTARAVAGYEIVTAGEGIMTLGTNPPGGPGLQLSGGASLSVQGGIVVDATGTSALDVSGGGTLSAEQVTVSGGTSGSSSVRSFPSGGGPSPLVDNTGVYVPDPLANLAAPSTSSPGVYTVVNDPNPPGNDPPTPTGIIRVESGDTQIVYPGIYSHIYISGGTVTFDPGIYVVTGGRIDAINITGGTVTGTGVMFYDTASNYDPYTGTDTGGWSSAFGGINIGGSGVTLSGLNDPTSPYNGMLFFMDRSNTGAFTSAITIQGGSGGATVSGTTYAPTGSLFVSGSGTWNSQFLVNSMSITGGGTVTIQYSGQNQGLAPEVFLVE